MEFEVKAESKTEGTKENSKGEEIDINITTYRLIEIKGEMNVSRALISMSLKVDGDNPLELSQGDKVELKVKTTQTTLGTD